MFTDESQKININRGQIILKSYLEITSLIWNSLAEHQIDVDGLETSLTSVHIPKEPEKKSLSFLTLFACSWKVQELGIKYDLQVGQNE